jgi:tRNA-2-methylthio-N6-dimethylallyladenosine synthase
MGRSFPNKPSGQDQVRPTFYIRTFGCQMNENDSEYLAGLLAEAGFAPGDSPQSSDLVIVNTCSVREKSEEKLFSFLGRLAALKREKRFRLAVAGCSAQAHGERIMSRVPEVDLVLGPDSYGRLPRLLRAESHKAVDVDQALTWSEDRPRTYLRESPISAYVTIMEGCDNFCAYCIVPFTRGRERYRPLRLVLAEIEDLAHRGYQEIILLGQNVNSYRDPESESDFPLLLRRMAGLPGLKWIRFITSHPKNFSGEIIRVMQEIPLFCRQVHLPLQSGSNRILARMNRSYTQAEYLRLADELRESLPEVELSTDVIVGFPGETEEDFEDTLRVLNLVRFANIFSFRYSPRPFTASSRLADDVPPRTKQRRLMELQERQKQIQIGLNQALVGRRRMVLCTGPSKKNAGAFCGRDESYRVINFTAREGLSPIHRFVWVRITGCGPYSLRGELTEEESKN